MNPAKSRSYGSLETRCGLDPEKMHAYEAALVRNVKDKVVCDIGTGPGILAYIALKAGAKKVYCIEDNEESINTAKLNLKEFGDRAVFIQKDAGIISYPEDIEYTIHEVLGSLVYDENILRIAKALHKSNLLRTVAPKYYEMFTYRLETKAEEGRFVYDINKYPPLTQEFHNEFEKNFPGVIEVHCTLGDAKAEMVDVNVFHTWSMLDPIETWGTAPRSVLEKFRNKEVYIGWRAYLEPDLYFGNYPREGNNWIWNVTFQHSFAKRFLNQIKLVEDIQNPFREETCPFLK